jgi:short-subunit dehydrogenase
MYNDKYALITGASDGFGKALALQCASLKMNVILVALPGPELYYLASFIQNNYGVKAVCFEKDLSEGRGCHELFQEVTRQKLLVNVLINNAGIGNTNFFEERESDFYEKQIHLNVITPTILSRLFLDNLKQTAPAYILNVSSLASFFYLPKKQVYGATKSYLVAFSKSLRRELKKDNISVSVACPAGMNTNVQVSLLNRTGNWLTRISIANPEDIAPMVIKNMLKGKEVIIPGFISHFYLLLDKFLPAIIKKALTNKAMHKLKTAQQSVTSVTTVQPSPMAA